MSYESKLKPTFMLIAIVSFLGLGFIQIAAIYAFFNDVWSWWAITNFVAAMFITYIPLLGAAAGTYAAYEIWGWTWYLSALLFFWPVVLAVFAGLFETASSFKNKQ